MFVITNVEGKYLHNFSHKEREKLMQTVMNYKKRLGESDPYYPTSPSIPMTPEVIKYALNRIAANDPQDTSFRLFGSEVKNPNRLALDIAKAFRGNTVCKYITLWNIRLTDEGMIPILRSLPRKLHQLDIRRNNITDESLQVLDTILADPKTDWKQVKLGEIHLTRTRATSFRKHPNLDYWEPGDRPVWKGMIYDAPRWQ